MEIHLEVKNEYDGGRQADELRRDIQKRFPDALWNREGDGYKILV